jgi:predicted DCC family thiol-disulfide oxidoreductase YuxK
VSEITVIYDGQCELCKNAVSWVSKKVVINAVDFHSADLSMFALSRDQYSREVFVFYNQSQWSGAAAVAFLLKKRGNRFAGMVITVLGPISRFGYRWIASHRNTFAVKVLSRLLAQ